MPFIYSHALLGIRRKVVSLINQNILNFDPIAWNTSFKSALAWMCSNNPWRPIKCTRADSSRSHGKVQNECTFSDFEEETISNNNHPLSVDFFSIRSKYRKKRGIQILRQCLLRHSFSFFSQPAASPPHSGLVCFVLIDYTIGDRIKQKAKWALNRDSKREPR